MVYFARVSGGLVVDKHVVADGVVVGADGKVDEKAGQDFLSGLWGGDPADYVWSSTDEFPSPHGVAEIGWTYNGSTFTAPEA